MSAKVRLRIRQKIIAGTLPGEPPTTTWASMGSGLPCGACEEPIRPSETEMELELRNNRPTVRLHRECYEMWKDECDHR